MENYIPKEEAKGYIVIDVDTSQVKLLLRISTKMQTLTNLATAM